MSDTGRRERCEAWLVGRSCIVHTDDLLAFVESEVARAAKKDLVRNPGRHDGTCGGPVNCTICAVGDEGPTTVSQEDAALNALALILPMAKGYAAAHPVGSNARYIEQAEEAIRAAAREE